MLTNRKNNAYGRQRSANRFDSLRTQANPGDMIMSRLRIRRILDLSLAVVVVAGAAVGWSCSKKDKAGDGAGATYTIWDPYPHFDNASGWVQLLNKCGSDAGVAIKRV